MKDFFTEFCVETLNGKKTIVAGKGEPLVFLHGFMSSKEAFRAQIEFFSKYFTVYAPDLCGFGENREMAYPYSLDDYVRELDELIDSVGGKACVIAHSFGCRVALKEAASSDRISKAVLCGVAGLKPPFSAKRTAKRACYKLLRPFISRERAEKLFFSPDYLMTEGTLRESFKKVTGEYLDGALKRAGCPILCVFGENDRETPPTLAKRLKKNVSRCDCVIMKGCGHFCFAENPAEFNYVTREFLL